MLNKKEENYFVVSGGAVGLGCVLAAMAKLTKLLENFWYCKYSIYNNNGQTTKMCK